MQVSSPRPDTDPEQRFSAPPLPKPSRSFLDQGAAPFLPRTTRQTVALENASPLLTAGGLEPQTTSLSEAQVRHLLRRTAFGAPLPSIAALTGQSPTEVVDQMVDEAVNQPMPLPPPWANHKPPQRGSSDEEFNAYFEMNQGWLEEYLLTWHQDLYEGDLRERMTLLWHNHLVTSYQSYFLAPFAYRYLTILRTHALGNFKQMVYEIGQDAAMLVYLNGNLNNVSAPNENYARELLELFTMGQFDDDGSKNYTQEDIVELARALTGWVVDFYQLESYFVGFFHDYRDKTIMGRTGAFGYDEVIDLLFEERGPQIARFVCRKLYRELAYAVPNEAIVSEMAQVFLDHDFEIAPVVRVLLKSAHFLDEEVIGAAIKSPVDFLTGMAIESGYEPNMAAFDLFYRVSYLLEQTLLSPPNVAGWPGYHHWLTTTTLPIRWLVAEVLLFGINNQRLINLIPLAVEIQDPFDEMAAFLLPTKLAEHLIAVPASTLDIGEIQEPFGGDLENFPIPESVLNGPPHVINLTKLFLGGLPWYEWNVYAPGAESRLLLYVRYLTQLPEFNLA